jgi:hypothetical protein
MEIQIRNKTDLIDFINSDGVTLPEALKVVSIALDLIIVQDLTKQQLVKETEEHIEQYFKTPEADKPIFLIRTP